MSNATHKQVEDLSRSSLKYDENTFDPDSKVSVDGTTE
jgi:hypothetical protein